MDTVATRSPSLSTVRSAIYLLALIAAVAVRFSSLPVRESLAPHTAATLGTAIFSAAAVSISVLLAIRSATARHISVILAALATLSCALQVAKIHFATVGHRELVFDDHVLVAPRGSLAYFNLPLVVTCSADIVLLFIGLALSMASAAALHTEQESKEDGSCPP
ncbi:hypothetical protein [Nocardia xishanensis]